MPLSYRACSLARASSRLKSSSGVKVKIIEPGGVKTDFATRSLDLQNDESLVEYQAMLSQLMAAFGPMAELASDSRVVAECIHGAVTDGTDQLRYRATPDAVELLSARDAADDATFFAGIKSQFGL